MRRLPVAKARAMSSIARIVSLTVLTALIIILGMTFLQVVTPFLLPLFLAGVVSILCQPIFRYFIGRTHNRVRVAAGLTTAVLLSVLLIPLLVGTLIASLQLYTLTVEKLGTADWTETFDTLQINLVAKVQPYLPENIDPAEVQQNVRRMLKLLAERSLGLAGTTLGLMVSAGYSSSEAAVGTLPLILIPQICFCSVMVPLRHMGALAKAITWITIERFSFDATLKTGEYLGSVGVGDGKWERVPMMGPLYDLGLKSADVMDMGLELNQLVGALAGFAVAFLVCTLALVWRRDRPVR